MAKSRLRVSLLSLFLAITLLSIALAAFNQYRQSCELVELQARVEAIEDGYRLRARVIGFINYFDSRSESNQQSIDFARTRARRFITQLGNSELGDQGKKLGNIWETRPKLIDVDGDIGNLEILTIANDFHVVPGYDTSVNVLFNGHAVVDILTREIYTRKGMFDTKFADVDGDGIKDISFERFVIDSKTSQRVYDDTYQYSVTPDGFQRIATKGNFAKMLTKWLSRLEKPVGDQEFTTAQAVFDNLTLWSHDELILFNEPDDVGNQVTSVETNRWIETHLEELKKMGVTAKWNVDSDRYELND